VFIDNNIHIHSETNTIIYDSEFKLISTEDSKLNDFIVMNKVVFLNKPYPNYDDLHMCLLLPLLLTDLNFALRFQSHSIIYGVNIKAENLAMTPNSFWSFESSPNEQVQLGTIEPKVEVDKMLSAIEQQFLLWLDTKNIKVQSLASNNLSGIAKAIDNSSIDEQIQANQKIFKRIEIILWRKLFNKLGINDEGLPNILFLNKETVIITTREIIDNNVKLLDNNLKTKKQVLEELYSDKSSEEIDLLLLELNKVEVKANDNNNNINTNVTNINKDDTLDVTKDVNNSLAGA
jgi:hypothetical protein